MSRDGELPLSHAQRRLWFLDRLEGDSGVYTIPMAWRLRGTLDVAALGRSLDELCRRHEALRTIFPRVDGRPLQKILDAAPVALPIADLAHLDPAGREVELQRRLDEEAARLFQLDREAPIRCALIRLAADEHALLISIHHIAFDGWSLGVFRRELSALYAAFATGRAPALPELEIQYADFAAAQQGVHQLGSQLDFWKKELEGAPGLLELPHDRPRPAVQKFLGDTVWFALDPVLVARVEAFARASNATSFMVLLAAYSALLSRLSAQEDISIGSPIANRTRSQTEGLIGCFINTIVLRARPERDRTFRELVAAVKKTALDAYAHQDLPFETLIEKLAPQRNLSHSPLFQVMFVLQNSPLPEWGLPGLEVSSLHHRNQRSVFDLTLTLTPQRGGLSGSFEYDVQLFDRATIERMAERLSTLLRAALEAPDQTISELPVLSADEEYSVVSKFNDTLGEYPRTATLHDLVFAQAASAPSRIAVDRVTYGELAERARRIAGYLVKSGVQPGQAVGICLPRSPDLVAAALGAMAAGCFYVPFDPNYPAERLAWMRSDAKTAAMIDESVIASALCGPELSNTAPIDPESIAYLIYTSGSTGRPKGVEVRHRSVVNFLTAMRRELGIGERDVQLAATTFSFDIAVLDLFLPLISGARLELADRATASDGRALAARIAAAGVTVMQATPATWRMLSGIGWRGRPELTVITGGEAVPLELARELSARVGRLYNLYGPTEATIGSTLCRLDPVALAAPGAVISIGRPLPNTRIYILDENGAPAPIGVPGELFIGGEGVARGYLGRPELNAAVFVEDRFQPVPGRRMYRTGDRARWRSSGELEFLGRRDDQIKVRGFRIELGEIEAALGEHREVHAAAVIARGDQSGDKHLVAFVVPHGGQLDTSVLREHAKKKLPEHMIPSRFISVDALPLTPVGKIDRRALAAYDLSRFDDQPQRSRAVPADAIERRLMRLYADVLGMRDVAVDQSFFELGGHSLLAVTLIDRIERSFGRTVPLMTLFRAPSIRELAAILRENRPLDGSRALEEIQPAGMKPPLFFVGSTRYARKLAPLLGPDQPVYGLNIFGLKQSHARDGTIEIAAVAQRYVAEILETQPEGPYRLAAYCADSKLAIEVAAELLAAGHQIAALAFIDTVWLGESHRSLGIRNFALNMLDFGPGYFAQKVRRRVKHWGERVDQAMRFLETTKRELRGEDLPLRLQHAWLVDAYVRALVEHRAEPYAGKIDLFLSHELRMHRPAELERLAGGGLRVHVIPGFHDRLFESPNIEVLADELVRVLDDR